MQRSFVFLYIVLPITLMVLFITGVSIFLNTINSSSEIIYKDGKGRLKGKIILEDGSPNTEKIHVSYTSRPNTETSNFNYSSGPQVTDSFELEALSGETYLMVSSPNHAPSWLGPLENHADGLIEDLVIVLKKGVPLDISLSDESGNPVIDANARGFPFLNNKSGSSRPFKETMAGVYRIENVNDLTYTISIEAEGFQPTTFEVENPETVGIYNKQLVKAHPTTGTVIDADNQPVAGAKFLFYYRVWLVAGEFRGSHGANGKEIGVTDELGNFELNELMDAHEHFGIIEAPDKRRVAFKNLEAGKTGLVYEMPPLRTLHGKITGDLVLLDDRYFSEFNEKRPCVKVDQEFTYFVSTKRRRSEYRTVNDYLPLEIQDIEATFVCPGIFSEKVEVRIGPYRVEFNPDDYAKAGDLLLEFNMNTGEKTIQPYTMPE